MMKSKNIIILGVVLALLVGAYFFLTNRPEPEIPQVQSEKISLLSFDKNEIEKIELTTDDGVLTFNQIEKEVEEEKDGKKEKVKKAMWEAEYPHEITLKQMSVDDIAYSFANLQAERVIEEETPDDLEPYGLKDPQAIAKATLKDGSEKILYLGDETPAGNTYYLMVHEDPKVYEVWTNHGQHFLSSLDDVRDKTLNAINPEEFAYLKIDNQDGRPIEIKLNDMQSEEQVQYGLSLWQMSQPFEEPMGVDSQALMDMLETLPTFSIGGFVEDGAQDLAKYGLDPESAKEFVIKDNENTIHLLFGKEFDEESIYFKTPDSDSVYSMKKSSVEFMDIKPFKLVEKFAYIVNIDDVDKIIVEDKGKTHTLTLTRETQKAEGEDEEDEVITTYKVDGEEVEEKPFKKAYQSIIGILVDGESDIELSENPEIKTTFFLNKGNNREVHINYVPFDNDFYAVFRSGKAEFVVNQGIVHSMLDDIEKLIRGD
ncbi:MAG TPA: DUF4340 domain-containing protein, partial [Clostridia bacterium]|nr:DUF4340 domain-containing protein [Clostridia bacterium]